MITDRVRVYDLTQDQQDQFEILFATATVETQSHIHSFFNQEREPSPRKRGGTAETGEHSYVDVTFMYVW